MTKQKETKNRNNYLPSYIRIKSDIINRITDGELKRGDKLPTEKEFCEYYKVSRITVRDALRELTDAGIIRRIHGSGSYVECDDIKGDYEDIFSHITQSPDVTISFGVLNPTPENEMLLKTMAGIFSIENPGVKVNIINIPLLEDRTDDPYLSLIRKGNLPTVGEFFMYAHYAKLDALMPLDTLPNFDRLKNYTRPQCIYPTLNSSGEAHVHAIVAKLDTLMLLINKDMATAAGLDPSNPPADWHELEQWTATLGLFTKKSTKGYYGSYSGIPAGWHCVIANLPYLRDGSVDYENNIDGLINMLRAPRCLEGLKFLHRTHQVGNPSPGEDGMQLFALGRVGILLSGMISAISLNFNTFGNFKIKAVQIPAPQKNMPKKSLMGNGSLGIFRSAINSNAELMAAWDWIRFLFRKKQQYLLSSDFHTPALKNIPSPIHNFSPELDKIVTQTVENSIQQFDFTGVREALACFGTEMRHSIYGEITAEQCISNTITKLTELKHKLSSNNQL
ncbi:MAG: extracellular solute-binding protein [Victivallaceae bacterium]|nr:extracellular solute-binding protein [Victivallaceae bacterium]